MFPLCTNVYHKNDDAVSKKHGYEVSNDLIDQPNGHDDYEALQKELEASEDYHNELENIAGSWRTSQTP